MTKTEYYFNLHITRKINIQKPAEPPQEPPAEQWVGTWGMNTDIIIFQKMKVLSWEQKCWKLYNPVTVCSDLW